MKKICMITHDAPYIDRRILLQAKSLVKNGYSVSIIYPFGESNSDFENVGINYIPVNPKIGIKNSFSKLKKVIRTVLPQKLYESLKATYFNVADTNFIDYEKELKEIAVADDYDIYVAHDLPALPIAHYASMLKSSKLVYDSHEFFTGQIALKGKRKHFFEILEKKFINDVDLMFTVNDDIAELFYKTYGVTDIKILLNSIEDNIKHQSVDLHNKLNISENKNIILYQGGFLEDRNLERLVESAQFLDDNNVLVMLGYSFLEDKLKNIAKKLNIINQKVLFMDRVPQKELLNYTSGALIGVIPYPDIDLNTKYCTPNKIFEFIAAEIPVVANERLITVSKILNDFDIGFLISFDNHKKIASGLNYSVREVLRVNMKKNLSLAKEKLSWQNQENILLENFTKL